MSHTDTDTSANPVTRADAVLVLADGSVFFGYGIGKQGKILGEVCFNTAMTGYQEILTDPSYAGQIVTFTFPHIGNVGTNDEDIESTVPAARGLILRAPITNPSNFRSQQHLNDWLIAHSLTGITGIDTRALTRHIRLKGAQNVGIAFADSASAIDIEALKAEVAAYPSLKGMELAKDVTRKESEMWQEGLWQLSQDSGIRDQGSAKTQGEASKPSEPSAREAVAHLRDSSRAGSNYNITVVDFGVKQNILRHLAERGCKVTVVPAETSAADILAQNPDGILLSNGPGDPAATGQYALPMIRDVVDSGVPVFGICLGHQMLGLSQGCTTEKMFQGHRGANHPVQDLDTGRVFITSQNHGFVISDKELPDHVEVTHRSLFDGTVQGIRLKSKPAFSVQGHPEASPGPHDFDVLFDRFIEAVAAHKNREAA